MGLVHQAVEDVGDGHPLQGVEIDVPAHVGHRLEYHAPHRRMLQTEFQDGAHLIGVDAPLDGRHQHRVQTLLRHPVQRPQLQVQQVLAADGLVGLRPQPVELEIDYRLQLGEPVQEGVVPGDTHAVGVDHHLADTPALGRLNHLQQVGVDGGLAAAELDDLGVAFDLDEPVQHELHLIHGQAEARAGVGEADWAVQVAAGIYFDQGQAHVLLVLRAQAAVQGAAVFDLGAEFQGQSARLVEFDRVHIHLGVGADDALGPAVGGAPFAHVDLVVADDDLGVYDRLTFGADAAGQLVEDVVRVLFDPKFLGGGFDQVEPP